MNGNARARRHRRASSSSPTHRGRARAHARAEHRARTRGDHPRRTIRRVNLSRIHPSIRRAVERSIERAIVSPITTRREGGATATTTKGGGRDYRSRLVAVSPRLIFIPTGTGRTRVPDASIVAPTSSPSLGTFDRDRADPIARVSRRLGRFFAGTVAHGGAREDDGRRRRETGDGRRETRDERRETRDARRARRRRPSRRLDEGGRGTRREDGVGALFPRVCGREGGTRSPVITPRG